MTAAELTLSDAALDKAIVADVRRLEGAVRTAVETAWRLGQRLTQRRERTPHGEWAPYLATIWIGISPRLASTYMRLGQIGSASDLGPSIKATLAEIGEATAARDADRAARDDRLLTRLESAPDGVEPLDHLQAMLDKGRPGARGARRRARENQAADGGPGGVT